MIDFLLLCYFMYGLFYAGKTFESICNYSIDTNNEELSKRDLMLVVILTVLTVLLYPFVIGLNQVKN